MADDSEAGRRVDDCRSMVQRATPWCESGRTAAINTEMTVVLMGSGMLYSVQVSTVMCYVFVTTDREQGWQRVMNLSYSRGHDDD